jgi:PAS domain S-box-containing protein
MANTLEPAARGVSAATVLGSLVLLLTAPGLASLALLELQSSTPLAGLVMRPMSAVGLFCLGVALLCHARVGRWRTWLGTAAALTSIALGLATLAEALLPNSPATRAWLDPQFHAPGLVALSLVAIGTSLAFGPRSRLSAYTAVVGLGTAWLLVLGGAYEAERVYASFDATASFDAEITTLLAAFGALLRHQELGLVAALSARDAVGSALRRSLVAAGLIPSLFGQLALAGKRSGLYGDATGTALLAASSMIALAVVAFVASTGLRRAHAARSEADAALALSEARYRRIVDRAAVGIAQLAPDGRWLQVNEKLCEMLGYDSAELLARTYGEISHLEDLALGATSARRDSGLRSSAALHLQARGDRPRRRATRARGERRGRHRAIRRGRARRDCAECLREHTPRL